MFILLLATKTDLDAMHYAFGASIESQKIGDAPPRTDIVESITSWVNQDNEQQIYLLLGPKGSGKSTIAHTIARQFEAIVRLGSSYCFSPTARDKRNVTNLFSTIARDLADHDPQYMKALWGTVKEKRALRETINPLTQFNRFILIPASQMTCIGPVLVVIDGLEYSGSESARKDLLVALAEKGAELPRNFKLLVTCRPEEDICAAFEGRSHVIQKHLKHHANSTLVPPPISGKNQTSRPRFRPPTPPLSIPEFTRFDTSLGANSSMIVTNESTPISGISGSGSAVSAEFDTWDDDCDPTESPPSSVSSINEVSQPSKTKAVVQYTRRSQEFVTVEQISETGGRTIKGTNLEKLESWIVEQHDHPQSGLLLKELGFFASAEPANDLPPMIGTVGLSGRSSRLPQRPRQKQVRAKTLVRHSTNVDGAEILGRDDDLACR
jgi:energy-coupling factor transporter ATP-binding protein EcfA2